MNFTKTAYSALIKIIAKCSNKDKAKEFDAKFRFHRILNLKNPKSLSEKICYLENHLESDLIVKCTDKWAVRDYIESKGLAEILVPTLGGPFDDVNQIDFSTLPDKFVIKATHGCKMNLICEDKSSFNEDEARKTIKKWIKTKYGAYSCEWHYENIKPRFYVEKYLCNNIVDYKITCFNGQPKFILVCSDRDADGHPHINCYDLNWKPIDNIVDGSQVDPKLFPKPSNFDRMLEIAKVLSKDFYLVRVDLYDIDGKIYFGELTFTPANGVLPYFSEDFLMEMGKELDISEVIQSKKK